MISSMARARSKKLRGDVAAETRLPPVEAFTFKSFIANMDAQGNGPDISADLDRIAEICARSRYSLSNQYEVHYAPHGSGSTFLPRPTHSQEQGPTLQAVTSDDERNMRRQRKRRSNTRRSSRAMGTLETIMSSSRSSDEEKTKKKSAAEIAEEIRGRAARKDSGSSSPTNSSGSTFGDESVSPEEASPARVLTTKKSGSLALIEGAKHHAGIGESSSPRASATGLVGEPAVPQASTSHLEIRTARDESLKAGASSRPQSSHTQLDVLGIASAKELSQSHLNTPSVESRPTGSGLLTTLSSWIPWKSYDTVVDTSKGRAEGTLRDLLKTTDVKGKAVER
jgi:hypothetical protein